MAYKALSDLALREILPPSIRDDEQLAALAGALDPESQAIYAAITDNLPYLPNLANLPSSVVDLLAWQFHVDDYDVAADIAVRRALVESAIEDHKLHGTREGARRAIAAVIGDGNFTLLEWWQVAPTRPVATYRILIHVAFNSADVSAIIARLAIAANVRSHLESAITWAELDALGYTWDQLDALGLDWAGLDQFYFFVWVP